MADFNLQPLPLLQQQSIQAPGLGKLGDIMTGANAINTQLQTVFNSDIKRQFANKVQAAIDGVPAYITDSEGNEIQNPAYVAALKPLALEAYHAQVQTGDNTLMDDLNTLIKTQQSGRGNIDWYSARAVESQFNVFRTELEDLQARKISLTPAETIKYNELYPKYLELDSQYNQITQGKRLPYKGRTDEYNANLGRMQSAQADKAEFDVKNQKSEAAQKAVAYGDKSADTWLADKKDFIAKMVEVKKAALLASQVPTTNNPEDLFTVTKALAGTIEPGLAVTEGEVNGFLGKNQAQNVMQTVINLREMGNSLMGGAKLEEAAYKAGNGSAIAVANLKDLAAKLGASIGGYWSAIITGGTRNFKESVNEAIKVQFNQTIDEDTLNQIGGLFEQKFNARMPVTVESTNITLPSGMSKSPTEAPKQEELPKVPPSEYERIMLKPTPDVSGDFMTAKQNSINWLTESLTSFNTATDSKLRKRMLSAIKDVYGISERDYDMPADIDAALNSLSLIDAPNPTTQTVAPGKKTTSNTKTEKKVEKKATPAPAKVELKQSTKKR